MADHVHMMIAIPPKYSVSQVVGYIKGKSAIHIARHFGERRRNFVGQHFWARRYFNVRVNEDEGEPWRSPNRLRPHFLTDNAKCYGSTAFTALCEKENVSQRFTRPYTPRTNGKAERFIQTLKRRWPTAVPTARRRSARPRSDPLLTRFARAPGNSMASAMRTLSGEQTTFSSTGSSVSRDAMNAQR